MQKQTIQSVARPLLVLCVAWGIAITQTFSQTLGHTRDQTQSPATEQHSVVMNRSSFKSFLSELQRDYGHASGCHSLAGSCWRSRAQQRLNLSVKLPGDAETYSL